MSEGYGSENGLSAYHPAVTETELRRIGGGNPPPDGRGLSWTLETSHFPSPLTRWAATLFVIEESRSIKELCREYGMIIDGIQMKEFGGWVYTALVPLGGKAAKAPPRFLVPLLCRVYLPLRRRIANARRTQAEDRTGKDVDRWLGGLEQRMLDDGRELLRRDLQGMDDAALADTLDAATDLAIRGAHEHFRLHGVGVQEIGRLGVALERAGWTMAEITDLFTGLSSTSTAPSKAQQTVIDAAEAAGKRDVLLAATSLDDVRASGPAVADALDAYVAEWTHRAIRYEPGAPTIAERPDWVLAVIKDQAGRPAASDRSARDERRRQATERAAHDLGGGPDARDRVDRAQRAYPIREGNESATIGVPVAALRRVGLDIGRRMAADGRLERADDVFDLEIDETLDVLRHQPGAPPDPAGLAKKRREARLAAAAVTPPATLGPPEPAPPDLAGFPADIAESVEGLLWYTFKIFGQGESLAPPGEDRLSGIGVAPGVYEGTARIVLGEDSFDRIEPGDVLVCPITSPVWSMLFPALGALVCDAGGPLSHPAIIAREFGIPAVVGTSSATVDLQDGATVRVDGSEGTVLVLQ